MDTAIWLRRSCYSPRHNRVIKCTCESSLFSLPPLPLPLSHLTLMFYFLFKIYIVQYNMHCEKCVTYTSSLTQDSRENTLCKPSKWIELCHFHHPPPPRKKNLSISPFQITDPSPPLQENLP